jgi:Fe-Mn family superoxide dismutase
MPFQLPDLPLEADALEPHIDQETMTIHHDKHHAGYVKKLNTALEGTEFAENSIKDILKNIEQIPEDIRKAVINNGGGHANHSLF